MFFICSIDLCENIFMMGLNSRRRLDTTEIYFAAIDPNRGLTQ